MPRPIPVEIIPSHAHLSAADHALLFGAGHAGTIATPLSQQGQYAYAESVEIFGKVKAGIELRVLGPYRRMTQIEITPTEASVLGIKAPLARSGELEKAGKCRLKGPKGELKAQAVVIIPRPHLHLSDSEARALRVENGQEVTLDIIGEGTRQLDKVVVRVHPSYRLRLHVHPDLAREQWLTGVLHARLREISH